MTNTKQPDDTELATLDEQALIAHLRKDEDRVPRKLIDTCAARGDALVLALSKHLDTPSFGEIR